MIHKTLLRSAAFALAAFSLASCSTMADYDAYGAGVQQGDAVAVGEVLVDPAAFEGKSVRLTGPIHSVCKTKGCWMRVGDADQNVFVKFVDYGFFVPTDAEGREAIMEGVLTVKKIPLDEAKHYLEDEGKHAEAAALTVEPTEVTFMATGVALKK